MAIKPLHIVLIAGAALLMFSGNNANAALFHLIDQFQTGGDVTPYLTAYKDSGGVWTIGYGSTFNHDADRPVKQGDNITIQQARRFYMIDTAAARSLILAKVKVKLNTNQLNALISLVYNIGVGAFSSSTLLKMLNAGNYIGAADQFRAWVYDNGVKNKGLVKRREKERALFLS